MKMWILNKDHTVIEQNNFYLDSADLMLRKRSLTLKIRQIKNYDLTLKTKFKEGKKEYHQKITLEEFELLKEKNIFPKGYICDILQKENFDVSLIFIITSLYTKRYEINYKNNIVCLDKNNYSGIIDYELEVESESLLKSKELIKEILINQNIIDFKYNDISKSSRALLRFYGKK